MAKKLSHRAKLSKVWARSLVRVCAKRACSQTWLAEKFGVSQTVVHNILTGRTYGAALTDAASKRYLVTINKRYLAMKQSGWSYKPKAGKVVLSRPTERLGR